MRLVGAVGIEIASLTHKSNKENGVAPRPIPTGANWCLLLVRLLSLVAIADPALPYYLQQPQGYSVLWRFDLYI